MQISNTATKLRNENSEAAHGNAVACGPRRAATKLLPFCKQTGEGSHLRPLSMAATIVRHWFWTQRNPTAYCNGVPLGRIHKEHSRSKPACVVNSTPSPVVRHTYSSSVWPV